MWKYPQIPISINLYCDGCMMIESNGSSIYYGDINKCGEYLGQGFDDNPYPTMKRYFIEYELPELERCNDVDPNHDDNLSMKSESN